MKNQEKRMKKLRKLEEELVYATPSRAARLASEIVRIKATLFD